jgi:glucokinase-like ROK family protein
MKHSLTHELESGAKNASIKVNIIRNFILKETYTLAELSRDMDLSVPTVTKLVGDLLDDGFVVDSGKQETAGGRRPSKYGLNPDSGYFMGVDIRDFSVNMALINLNGVVVFSELDIPFSESDPHEGITLLCKIISGFLDRLPVSRDMVLNVGVNISGRVNSKTGMSYTQYFFHEQSLSDVLQDRLGLTTTIDNDSRSMLYGEFMSGCVKDEKNVLFINISWGLGSGIITDGIMYYGKSGFSGEIGHMSVFDNEILCHCGKKGCLETQASGYYIYNQVVDKIAAGNSSILQNILNKSAKITLNDIIDAALNGDLLTMEVVEEVGFTLGKSIASLINLFNPELVIIGGSVARAGDCLLFPIKSAVRKHSLNLVGKDTVIKESILGDKAGVIGACLLARSKMLNMI